MAKKKEKAPKKDNLLLWGIGVLILIVIIIIIARGCETQPAEEDTTVDEEPDTDVDTEPEDEEPVVLGLEEVKCDESATIGYKSCSLLENGNIEFTILHQGSATLLGVQYYIYDENNNLIGEDAQMTAIEGNSEATLTLPVSKFTGVESVEIRPVMTVEGADSICLNQRVIQHVDRC